MPRFGSFQSRREAGQPAADHQDVLGHFLLRLVGLGQFRLLDSRHAHAHVIFGHHLRVFLVGRLAPDHLLTNIGPLQDAAVELENVVHDARGTRGDDQLIGTLIGNIVLDELHPFLAAQVRMVAADGGFTILGGHLAELPRYRAPHQCHIRYKYILQPSFPLSLPPDKRLDGLECCGGAVLNGF